MTTFAELLAGRLRHRPGDPLVTYYDAATGERTELSTTTYANWVAKTAGLFLDELDLTRGDRVRIALPAHWLGPVFEGAAWLCGLCLTTEENADLVVCGPDPAGAVTSGAVLATALLPLGGRFPGTMPPGVTDFGSAVWGQPDGFTPWDPAEAADAALPGMSQDRFWRVAAADPVVGLGGRLVSTANPLSRTEPGSFAVSFARRGSLVLVRGGDEEFLSATYAAERGTDLDPARPVQPTRS